MTNRRVLVASGGALIAAAAAVGLWLQREDPAPALRPDDARVVAAGERIYRMHCAACHGAKLEGQPNWRERGPDGMLPAPPHDESGHTWHHPDEVLFRITKHGVASVANMPQYRSAMPAYDGVLTDDEIVAVLSWIKAQWPPKVRAWHDQANAQYRQAREP